MALDTLEGLTIAIYARFSSSKQRDTSIEDQVRVCREHIIRNQGVVRDDLVFVDRAVSGTVVSREGYDKLLKLVERKAIEAVVTEEGGRLSRDLGDSDRLWKRAEFNRVRLILVNDGIDSAREGSRTAFRFKAVMSDEYIHNLAKSTLRGLHGAFERDQATGGLAYGYDSKPNWTGGKEPDGYDIVIDPVKRDVVVKIFTLYAAGRSLGEVAKILRDDGVPPPRAKSAAGPTKFWRKNTLSFLLANRSYLGEFSFGKRKWFKEPDTRKRRYVKQSNFKSDLRPDLALVPPDLWHAVQERRARTANNLTRKAGDSGRRTAHPYSGLLFCGACGSRFVDVGGSATRYYRCSAATQGGGCTNVFPIREDLLNDAAMSALQELLGATNTWQQVSRDIDELMKTASVEAGDERAALTSVIKSAETAIDRLVAFITATEPSSISYATIQSKLDAAAQQKKDAELALAALHGGPCEAPRLPTVEEALATCRDIEGRVKADPVAFREFMRSTFLSDGRIVLDPQPDGSYWARSRILPLRIPPALPTKSKAPAESSTRASGPVGPVSCGGRI
jgi:site-specific DNA recombinase